MKHPLRISIHRLTACGILACLYAVLTISTAAISYGPIQFRIAEALCVLPFFVPWSVWGLGLGCALANLFSTASVLDVAVGTAATLFAGFLSSRCRHPFPAVLPPIFCNAIGIGALLAATGSPGAFWQGFGLYALQVGLGEGAVLLLLGLPLLLTMKKQGLDARLRGIE